MDKKQVFTEESDDTTCLTAEEREDLIPSWITLRAELNELEALGLVASQKWLLKSKPKEILSEDFIRKLHKKMFGEVWKWAGKFRITEKNIGVAPYDIAFQLKLLLDDLNFWITNKVFAPVEIVARFHHRLVFVHPFPNGNGRLSRAMADLLAERLGEKRSTWGESDLQQMSEIRYRYISALREADCGNYEKLIKFVAGAHVLLKK